MDIIVIIMGLAGLALLDLAAMRWGADTTDGFNSPEWQRRLRWHAPGHHDS